LCKDFESYNGIPPENEIKVWETAESMERRMNSVLQKYTKYQRVIVVCHGMVIRTIKYQEKIAYSEIIEYILKNK
jgi:broad specificity phosphatase PhoE